MVSHSTAYAYLLPAPLRLLPALGLATVQQRLRNVASDEKIPSRLDSRQCFKTSQNYCHLSRTRISFYPPAVSKVPKAAHTPFSPTGRRSLRMPIGEYLRRSPFLSPSSAVYRMCVSVLLYPEFPLQTTTDADNSQHLYTSLAATSLLHSSRPFPSPALKSAHGLKASATQ